MLYEMAGCGTVDQMPDSFSQRHGLVEPPPGTLFRDELPPSFRRFVLGLATDGQFNPSELQHVICEVLQVWPTPNAASYFDCEKHIKGCEWFRVYDIIERICELMYENTWQSNPGATPVFIAKVNKALVQENIGWQLTSAGKFVTRGEEAFEGTVKTAMGVLAEAEKPTAAQHVQSAILALSARPKPNTSGAVAHATNAVECVLGSITGQAMTLGAYLDKHPNLFHPALKKGLYGVYGYASDEGARHGKEGTEPAREDAEFVVATCAAVCTLLTRKHPK